MTELELLQEMWMALHNECHSLINERNYDTFKKMEKHFSQPTFTKEEVEAIHKDIQKHAYPVRYDTNSIEKGMTLTGINQVFSEHLKENG